MIASGRDNKVARDALDDRLIKMENTAYATVALARYSLHKKSGCYIVSQGS
jgi:hypothetical protein